MHTQFLTDGLADELQLVVAPFFVGNPEATRFVGAGRFPWSPAAGPGWSRPGRSATWCCSAMPCPPVQGSRRGEPRGQWCGRSA